MKNHHVVCLFLYCKTVRKENGLVVDVFQLWVESDIMPCGIVIFLLRKSDIILVTKTAEK